MLQLPRREASDLAPGQPNHLEIAVGLHSPGNRKAPGLFSDRGLLLSANGTARRRPAGVFFQSASPELINGPSMPTLALGRLTQGGPTPGATGGTGAGNTPVGSDGIFCDRCGGTNAVGFLFCRHCGGPRTRVEAPV